jgi:SAM-dependent methyltransferase
LEVGCDNHFSLLLRKFTQYEIYTQNLANGHGGFSDISEFRHNTTGKTVSFNRQYFDLEAESFPYPENSFDLVVCAEVIEHLLHDPMAMLRGIHRILKPDGALVLTTPNLISWHAILKAIKGLSPLEFSCFITSKQPPILQHAREYMPDEVNTMLQAAGFSIDRFTTPYFLFPHEHFSVIDLLLLGVIMLWFPLSLRHPKNLCRRGPHIFVLARKTNTPSHRYPPNIYSHD